MVVGNAPRGWHCEHDRSYALGMHIRESLIRNEGDLSSADRDAGVGIMDCVSSIVIHINREDPSSR